MSSEPIPAKDGEITHVSDTALRVAAPTVLRATAGVEPPRPQFPPGDPTGVHRFARM